MNKIIINPHYCSREEYQELKDYLTLKTWDWQEISSGENNTDTRDTIEVLQHTVAYSYHSGGKEIEPNECDIEHIEHMIKEGYNQGELCSLDHDGENEFRGWWEII